MCQKIYEDDWCDLNQHFIPRSFALSLLPGLGRSARRLLGMLPCDQAQQKGRFGACPSGIRPVLSKAAVEACTGCRVRRAVGITARRLRQGRSTYERRGGRETIDELHPLTGRRMTEVMARSWARTETRLRARMEEQGLDPNGWRVHFFGELGERDAWRGD